MNPRVKSVIALDDYLLEIIFSNEEKGRFDLKPYLEFGLFSTLKEKKLFQTAKPSSGTIVWSNGLDICPDTLYLESKKM
jgi:hypothetical protein